MDYRSNAKFRVSVESGYCALPVGGDTYHNCPHDCLYCYERQLNNQHLRDKNLKPNDYRALFKSLYDEPDVREFVVKRNVPVRLGVCSDPFPHLEQQARFTLEMIKLLAKAGFQVQLTTKNPVNVDDEHVAALLDCPKAMIRVSFSTLDDEKARVLEPGSPLPSARLAHMRRLADAGIEVGARLAPFLLTENYDYAALAKAGVSNVTVELFRFSVMWRHSFPPEFWEVVSGTTMPDGDMKDKRSPRRKWAEEIEHAYFEPLQMPGQSYHSGGALWVACDVRKVRELWLGEREKAHANGLQFGICSMGCGIHSIDLNDGPCGCLTEGWNYDAGALVPAFLEDRWERYIVPEVYGYGADVALERLVIANSEYLRPLVLHPPDNAEQAVLLDAPVDITGSTRAL